MNVKRDSTAFYIALKQSETMGELYRGIGHVNFTSKFTRFIRIVSVLLTITC